MSDRCKVCDRPEATQDDWDTVPEGEGENLCWGATQCRAAPVNWRERALCAERALSAIRAAVTDYYNDPEGDVDDCMSRVIAMLDASEAGGDEG